MTEERIREINGWLHKKANSYLSNDSWTTKLSRVLRTEILELTKPKPLMATMLRAKQGASNSVINLSSLAALKEKYETNVGDVLTESKLDGLIHLPETMTVKRAAVQGEGEVSPIMSNAGTEKNVIVTVAANLDGLDPDVLELLLLNESLQQSLLAHYTKKFPAYANETIDAQGDVSYTRLDLLVELTSMYLVSRVANKTQGLMDKMISQMGGYFADVMIGSGYELEGAWKIEDLLRALSAVHEGVNLSGPNDLFTLLKDLKTQGAEKINPEMWLCLNALRRTSGHYFYFLADML